LEPSKLASMGLRLKPLSSPELRSDPAPAPIQGPDGRPFRSQGNNPGKFLKIKQSSMSVCA
jgi:hypothetical protein